MKNRGQIMIFIGYKMLHGRNVYKILKLRNEYSVTTRDVTWLGMTYGECRIKHSTEKMNKKYNLRRNHTNKTSDELDINDILVEWVEQNKQVNRNDKSINKNNILTTNRRSQLLQTSRHAYGIITITDPNIYPTTYNQEWNHPIASKRKGWRQEIH